MAELALAARLVLAGAFAFSAATKLADRHAFAAALGGFRVPGGSALSYVLPPMEATLAVTLAVPATGAVAAWAGLAFLALATAAVVANLGRGVPCPCFGPGGRQEVTGATVVRNGILAGLAVLATGPTAGAGAGPVALATVLTVPGVLVALRRWG